MNGAQVGLAVSVFLACAVEAVEATTIVLAVGSTRSWSSALAGVGAALLALAAMVAVLGPAIVLLPTDLLHLVVGALLLAFGLQWLRKAILRAAGLKALHDETAAFERETADAAAAGAPPAEGLDGYSFAISFKGVLLEGLEVVIIVITLGAGRHDVALAAVSAAAAVALVAAAGFAARRPLANVPENAMKMAVGVLLTSFGVFWLVEGAGGSWPGGDAALLAIVPVTLALAAAIVAWLRTAPPTRRAGG